MFKALSICLVSHSATIEASATSLATTSAEAFAATAETFAAAATDHHDAVGLRFARAVVEANIVGHLVAVAGVARGHIVAMEEKGLAPLLIDKAEALALVEELDGSGGGHGKKRNGDND